MSNAWFNRSSSVKPVSRSPLAHSLLLSCFRLGSQLVWADNGSRTTVGRTPIAFINNDFFGSFAKQFLALLQQGFERLAVIEVLGEILDSRDNAGGFGGQERNL